MTEKLSPSMPSDSLKSECLKSDRLLVSTSSNLKPQISNIPLWYCVPPFPSAVWWGGKRKAPLNFSFPLEGKCHVVAKGCTRVNIPMKLTIVLLSLTSLHLEVLCRTSTVAQQTLTLKSLLLLFIKNAIFINEAAFIYKNACFYK